MKKRLLCILFVLTIVAGLLTGCGKPSSTGGSSTAPGNVTLRFFWWGNDSRHKATLDVINLYMKNHPNVKIEAEYQGWDGYYQKLTTQLASGVAADLMQIDPPWVHDLSANGSSFMDLLQYKNVLDTSGFDKTFLKDYGYFGNKLYALPNGVNAYTMIINKALLTRCGIDVSNTTWDWDRVLNDGKKVHATDSNCYFMSYQSGLYAEVLLKGYIMQECGKQWINDDCTPAFTQSQLSKALAYVKKLYDENVAEPLGESELYTGKPQENPKWINKQIGCHITWTSVTGTMRDALGSDADIVSFPIAKGSKESGVMIRPSMLIAINKKTKYGTEAARFLNFFFNDKDAALILKDTRSIPAVSSSRQALIDANLLNSLTEKATEIAMKNPASPDNSVSANEELKTIFGDTVSSVVYNKMTPDKAAADMISQFSDKLKELKTTS